LIRRIEASLSRRALWFRSTWSDERYLPSARAERDLIRRPFKSGDQVSGGVAPGADGPVNYLLAVMPAWQAILETPSD